MITLNQDAPAAKAEKRSDQGSHWYSYDTKIEQWSPLYEPGGSFTLRQARKLKAAGQIVVPSVTTYFKVLHKQMLVDWKIEQALKAAAMSPFVTPWAGASDAETMDEWIDRIAAKADGASRGAADLGTRIHTAIEQAVNGEDYEAECQGYVYPVLKLRKELGLVSIGPEACIGNTTLGYAGRCDDRFEGMVVGDYKSRKTKPGRKVASYETDVIQLAAYGFAQWGDAFLLGGKGIIFVISTTEAGRVEPVHFTAKELREAFLAFTDLTGVWRYINSFDPRT